MCNIGIVMMKYYENISSLYKKVHGTCLVRDFNLFRSIVDVQ